MDLQISVFLLFVLFTAGHSFYCYECRTDSCTEEKVICPFGSWRNYKCRSATIVKQIGDISSKMKIKDCSLDCQSGSINLGTTKMTFSCCGTYLCNIKDAPDPRTMITNGKKCYHCDEKSCLNVMSCSGSEDRCVTATGTWGGRPTVVKGCISKSICDSTTYSNDEGISCCEGNLCNDDTSVTQTATPSFIHSFMYNGAKTVTQSYKYNVSNSVTQSFMYNDAKNAKKSFMYDNAKSVSQSASANSVTQSFLFLCFSLLSFILLH